MISLFVYVEKILKVIEEKCPGLIKLEWNPLTNEQVIALLSSFEEFAYLTNFHNDPVRFRQAIETAKVDLHFKVAMINVFTSVNSMGIIINRTKDYSKLMEDDAFLKFILFNLNILFSMYFKHFKK